MQLNLNKLMALISGIACSMSLAFAEPVGETLIENIRVIDGKGNAPVEAQDVLLADGKILRVADHGKIETANVHLRFSNGGSSKSSQYIDWRSSCSIALVTFIT